MILPDSPHSSSGSMSAEGSPSNGSLTTCIKTKEGTKRWTISLYSLLDHDVGQATKSLEFEAAGRSRWQLKIYPGSDALTEESKSHVSVYLQNHIPQPCRAFCYFTIINQLPGQPNWQRKTEPRDFGSGTAWGYTQFIRRDHLMDEKTGYKQNDTVELEVKIVCISEVVHTDTAVALSSSSRDPQAPLKTLGEDLSALLESGMHSDVKVLVAGVELHAHRAILAARSPVLKAMFSHAMSESLEGVVHISDVSPVVFKQLLRFIYSGSCVVDAKEDKEKDKNEEPDLIEQLLAAADRFQLGQLAELCSDKLSTSLGCENVADRLILADACHSQNLKRRCLEFISADAKRLPDVMDSDGFQRLSQAQLQEVLSSFAPAQNGKKRSRDAEPLTKQNVKRLKVSELKAELASRGLDDTGLKPELVSRLEGAMDTRDQ